MSGALLFLAAHAAVVVFGAPAAWHPLVRDARVSARVAAAFATGAIGLTAQGALLSLLGVQWTILSLGAPLVLVSATLTLVAIRARQPEMLRPPRARTWVTAAAAAVMAAGILQLAVASLTGRATATDLCYFWGVKALAHADGGLAAPLLGSQFAIHMHPTYPPLHATVLGWSAAVAGEMPWTVAPFTAVLWLLAAIPLVRHLLAGRVGDDHAAGVTAFWTVAIAAVLVQSCSGGNAEPPLVLYVTIAVAALLAEDRGQDRKATTIAALGLTGATLTKNEGAVIAALVVAGVIARDLVWQRPRPLRAAGSLIAAPAVAWGLWMLFRVAHALPLSDPIREPALAVSFDHVGTILLAGLKNLHGGTRGLVWLVPIAAILAAGCRRLADQLPALTLTCGLFAFLLVYYLHASGDPSRLIGWTLARVSVSALSALILAAGIATGFSQQRAMDGWRGTPAPWRPR